MPEEPDMTYCLECKSDVVIPDSAEYYIDNGRTVRAFDCPGCRRMLKHVVRQKSLDVELNRYKDLSTYPVSPLPHEVQAKAPSVAVAPTPTEVPSVMEGYDPSKEHVVGPTVEYKPKLASAIQPQAPKEENPQETPLPPKDDTMPMDEEPEEDTEVEDAEDEPGQPEAPAGSPPKDRHLYKRKCRYCNKKFKFKLSETQDVTLRLAKGKPNVAASVRCPHCNHGLGRLPLRIATDAEIEYYGVPKPVGELSAPETVTKALYDVAQARIKNLQEQLENARAQLQHGQTSTKDMLDMAKKLDIATNLANKRAEQVRTLEARLVEKENTIPDEDVNALKARLAETLERLGKAELDSGKLRTVVLDMRDRENTYLKDIQRLKKEGDDLKIIAYDKNRARSEADQKLVEDLKKAEVDCAKMAAQLNAIEDTLTLWSKKVCQHCSNYTSQIKTRDLLNCHYDNREHPCPARLFYVTMQKLLPRSEN